jgi:hypothetical protein
MVTNPLHLYTSAPLPLCVRVASGAALGGGFAGTRDDQLLRRPENLNLSSLAVEVQSEVVRNRTALIRHARAVDFFR